jgi:hypothetical protein
MISEGSQVFGQDNAVFNTLVGNYTPIVKAGPSQQGFSAAQDNALKAQIVQSTAVGYRNAAAAAKSGVAGFGGGNTVMTSGAGLNANVGVAQQAAATQAGELNKEQIADWSQGHQNWLQASQGLQAAPSVLTGATGFNAQSQAGLTQNMANAQAQDAASNWWVKPLEAGAMFAGSVAAPGLSKAFSTALNGGGGSTALTNPGLMQGPAPTPQAPDIGSGGQSEFNLPTF